MGETKGLWVFLNRVLERERERERERFKRIKFLEIR
jgi:hypothetical protein